MKMMVAALAAFLLSGCSPGGLQGDYVRLFMNDPDSVQFRDMRQSKREKSAWCGELNARNRMGGMVGFTRYVVVLPDDNARTLLAQDRETAKLLTKLHMDGTDGFDAKWRLWCV